MTEQITQSLCIPEIEIAFSEDNIIYICWKFGMGNVDRVDFEPHPEKSGFNIAYVYLSKECREWNFEQLHYNTEDDSYKLYLHNIPFQTQPQTVNDRFITFYKNPHPTPYAKTKLNIHQLFNKNVRLEEKNLRLEEKNLRLEEKNLRLEEKNLRLEDKIHQLEKQIAELSKK